MIIAGTGAPYALVAAVGLRFAPAYDGGALNPGCMPLFVALIAALVLGEKLSTAQKLGLSLILAGALIIVGWHAAGWSPARSFGDVLFLFAAFLTACFTVVMRQAKLDPLHVAALVSTGSLVIYLPIYLALYGTRLAQLMLAEIAIQAIFQGVLVTIVSLLLYTRAVAILGASGGAAFGSVGASAVGTAGNTAPRRVAKRNRLGRHRPHLRRRLSDKRRTIAEPEPQAAFSTAARDRPRPTPRSRRSSRAGLDAAAWSLTSGHSSMTADERIRRASPVASWPLCRTTRRSLHQASFPHRK